MTDNPTRPRLSARAIANLERREAEEADRLVDAKLANLMWPEGSDDDDSLFQDALQCRSVGDSGPLEELVDSGQLTREEQDRLAKIRRIWPSHRNGPLYPRRGRMFGERTIKETETPFNLYALELFLKERAERWAENDPTQKLLRWGERKKLIRWAMAEARERYPNGESPRVVSLVKSKRRPGSEARINWLIDNFEKRMK